MGWHFLWKTSKLIQSMLLPLIINLILILFKKGQMHNKHANAQDFTQPIVIYHPGRSKAFTHSKMWSNCSVWVYKSSLYLCRVSVFFISSKFAGIRIYIALFGPRPSISIRLRSETLANQGLIINKAVILGRQGIFNMSSHI